MRSGAKSFIDLFVVPSNSIGVTVPIGISCPLDRYGQKVLTSYAQELREGGAPDAEVEAVAEIARLGHMRIASGEDSHDGVGWRGHFAIRPLKAQRALGRSRRCLQCFLDPAKEFVEVNDNYGHSLRYGRRYTVPQIPKMILEVHRPPSNEEVDRYFPYEGEPEHSAISPLPQLKSVSQLAQLTSSELSEYLRFLALPDKEDAERSTKLELLKQEIGLDCLGEAEFSDEPLRKHESRALSTYLQCVKAQLTNSEAKMVKDTKVQSAVEHYDSAIITMVKCTKVQSAVEHYDSAIIERPCEMFRQRMFAAERLLAQQHHWDVPQMSRSEMLSEVPDWYGNVPSRGRAVHIPAQAASRTAVHIPGVDRVFRYIVLDAILEHPKVEPLPALTRVSQVMHLTPDQVNQYLKFYCVKVPEGADNDERLQLLRVELAIDHIGPGGFRWITGLELFERKMVQNGRLGKKLKVGSDALGIQC